MATKNTKLSFAKEPHGVQLDLMAEPKARFIPAQSNGLGNLEAKTIRAESPFHQAMKRAFSPHDFVFPAPSPLGWAGIKPGLWPSEPASLAITSNCTQPHDAPIGAGRRVHPERQFCVFCG